MARRRNSNPLAAVAAIRWLRTRDREGNDIECARIEPMADLRAVLEAAMSRHRAQGWTVEEPDGIKWGGYFASRGDERVEVWLTPSERPMLPHG